MTQTQIASFRQHTIRRLQERYGSFINKHEYNEMCKIAQLKPKSQYLLIRILDDSYEECFVCIYNTWFPVVFHRNANVIVTAIPKESTYVYMNKLNKHIQGLKAAKSKITLMEKESVHEYHNNWRRTSKVRPILQTHRKT